MKKYFLLWMLIATPASADNINIEWLNDDYTTNSTSSCEIGGDVELPTPPTKRGYTFLGWIQKNKFDISTLDTSIAYFSYSYDNAEQTYMYSFPYGDIYGEPFCSVTYGTQHKVGYPSTNTGQGCWCRITGFKPAGSDFTMVVDNANYVFNFSRAGYNDCYTRCAEFCARFLASNENSRAALFSTTDSD